MQPYSGFVSPISTSIIIIIIIHLFGLPMLEKYIFI